MDCVYVSSKRYLSLNSYISFISIIYRHIPSFRTFVALLGDGSLVAFAENCTSVIESGRWKGRLKVTHILALENEIIALCKGEHICKVQVKGSVIDFPLE
jgi:hypothetical protein